MDPIAHLNDALAHHYHVIRELGVGGTATVYLAEDLKHHRKVAIKVFRPDLSASVGADRFLREIEIVAQLQHPHILPLLDSGEAAGLLYYVMPYVEGQSLRQRLMREHELPIGEAVRLLVQIVDALTHAHSHGVVHRDIKPDNVMLSGRHALVADFGVARAISEASGGSKITSIGIALGTPSYMSPEQATADPLVDHRTDIYAVGVVAYELLAGQLPFLGASPSKVLAAHVMEIPSPVSKHRPGISPALEHTVMRCLEKRPADRWQSADELLAALEPLATPSGGMAPTSMRLAPVQPGRRRRVWIAAGLVVVIGAAAIAYRVSRTVTPTLALGRSNQLTTDAGLQINPAISPDGKLVAYASGNAARMRIFIRPVAGGRTFPLSDDSTALETNPRWSPDGSKMLFLANGGVALAPALGGETRVVVPRVGLSVVTTADWSPDGREIVFERSDTLNVVTLEGQATRVLALTSEFSDCHWSPTGRVIACVSGNPNAMRPGANFGNSAPSAIALVSAENGKVQMLTDHTTADQSPVWSRDGDHLYFVSNRDGPPDIYELALDRNGHPRGPAMRLTTGMNARSLSLSADARRVAYSVYSSKANIWTLAIPAKSAVSAESATPLTNENQVVESMRPTRDGRWLLFDADRNGRADVYRMPMTGGQIEQLTHETFNDFAPDLSPDGQLLAYHSWRTGTRDIEVRPLSGGPVEMATHSPAQESYPVWAPDGRRLAYLDQAGQRISVVRREAPGRWSAPTQLAAGLRPEWSPDGSSIVFASQDTSSIMIMPANGGPARAIYSASGDGPQPQHVLWSPDGTTLYFKSHDAQGHAALWSIPAQGGTPRLLVRFPDLARSSNRRDFGVDGKRFYFTIEDRQANVFVADVVPR